MLTAYVDLKKALDSVHREKLWDILRVRGIPARIIDLMTGLYSGTESAVKCGAGISSSFPLNSGVRQGCVLAPSLFNTCMDWVLGKVADQSHCGASVGNTTVGDLVFADDAVILAELLEVLVMALEILHEEAKPLGLEVSWTKTKVQEFGGLLDDTVQSVHACGEDIEVLESFTYLGSLVHNNGRSDQEVIRRIGLAYGVYCVVGTYAGGQSSASSRRLCSLSYCMAVRHGLLTVNWRGVSMSLIPSAFAGSWGTTGMTSCQTSDCSMKLSQGLLPA